MEESFVPFEIIINTVIPLLAACFGVWFAYKLQSRKDKHKEVEHRLGVLAKAYIVLLKKLNTIALITKQTSEYIDDNSHTINVQKFVIPEQYELDDLSLYFMALDDPGLYQDVLQSHDASVSVMTHLSLYNMYIDENDYYHALNVHGKMLSDAMEIVPHILNTLKGLRAYANKKYRQSKFITIEIEELDIKKVAGSIYTLQRLCEQMKGSKDDRG